MRIRKWEDLDGIWSDYRIAVEGYVITIVHKSCLENEFTSMMRMEADKEIILAWLKLFGFDIEFPEQKLNKRERNFCEYVETGWTAKDKYGSVNWCPEKPKKHDGHFWSGGAEFCTILPDLFQFIQWEDEEPYSVEEMLKWEVES
jgi:hypothetical protein